VEIKNVKKVANLKRNPKSNIIPKALFQLNI
jgi:hypothetical protein